MLQINTHLKLIDFNIDKKLGSYLFKSTPLNAESFITIINYYILKKWKLYDAFEYKDNLFVNHLELFEKVIDYYIKNKWNLSSALYHCSDVFKCKPELWTKVIRYQMTKITNKNWLFSCFDDYSECLELDLELFTKLVKRCIKNKISLFWALESCSEAFTKLPNLHHESIQYQKQQSDKMSLAIAKIYKEVYGDK